MRLATGAALFLGGAAIASAAGCRSANADDGAWMTPAPAPAIVAHSIRHPGEASLAQLAGRAVMLSFGYSHCLDLCPVTLRTLRGALQRLGGDADRVTPVYVSIDPDRDTPERLRRFVDQFDQRIDGWTVAGQELPRALAAYGVSSARRPVGLRSYVAHDVDPAKDYGMAHEGGIWLIDGGGRLRARYLHGASADAVARGVRKLLRD